MTNVGERLEVSIEGYALSSATGASLQPRGDDDDVIDGFLSALGGDTDPGVQTALRDGLVPQPTARSGVSARVAAKIRQIQRKVREHASKIG